jgi:hypothetical protein
LCSGRKSTSLVSSLVFRWKQLQRQKKYSNNFHSIRRQFKSFPENFEKTKSGSDQNQFHPHTIQFNCIHDSINCNSHYNYVVKLPWILHKTNYKQLQLWPRPPSLLIKVIKLNIQTNKKCFSLWSFYPKLKFMFRSRKLSSKLSIKLETFYKYRVLFIISPRLCSKAFSRSKQLLTVELSLSDAEKWKLIDYNNLDWINFLSIVGLLHREAHFFSNIFCSLCIACGKFEITNLFSHSSFILASKEKKSSSFDFCFLIKLKHKSCLMIKYFSVSLGHWNIPWSFSTLAFFDSLWEKGGRGRGKF